MLIVILVRFMTSRRLAADPEIVVTVNRDSRNPIVSVLNSSDHLFPDECVTALNGRGDNLRASK